MLRRFLLFVFRLLFRLFATVHVTGLENIPQRGGVIVAPNHLGIIDAPLIFTLIPRDDLTALVAKQHQKNLFLRLIVNGANGIWINRDEPDAQAVRASRKHLQQGGLLGIAPEGTRSKTGALQLAKTGVAYLAEKTRVPIIPAAITGTHNGIKRLFSFHRLHLYIQFGEPFTLPPLAKGSRDASLQRNTDEIMCRIAAMLPPTYRGVYADHPRLKEILEEAQAAKVPSISELHP